MAYSETIMRSGSITSPDPFTGGYELAIVTNPEIGYYLIWGPFQAITGIPWLNIILYFPGIIFILTVLSVYILARREGYGLAAAFFTCLIPTFRGTLGPAFMVPMALGLPFMPLSLFLVFNYKTWQSYLLVFIFTCLLFLMHSPTAAILIIIMVPYIVLNLKHNPRHSLSIALSLAIPVVMSIPIVLNAISSEGGTSFLFQGPDPYTTLPPLFNMYGYVPLAIGLLGMIWLAYRGNRNDLALLSGLLALVVMLVVFYRFHFGHSIVYARGLTSMLLMLSIMAGAGLLWIYKLKFRCNCTGRLSSFLCNRAGILICLPLIAISLFFSINSHFNTYYYHMIDHEDYQAFTWIRDNTGDDYSKTLLDPWKATAYAAITGNTVASRVFFHPEQADISIYEFLQQGCTDTGFLRDNRIGILYYQQDCNNTDLSMVRKDVYITNPDLIWNIDDPEALKNSGFEYIYDSETPIWWSTWYQNCSPDFLYPEPGRNGGTSVAISMNEVEPFDPLPSALWLQDISVEAGKKYSIKGWIKTDSIKGSGGAMISAHWKDKENNWLGATQFMSYLKGTSDWKFYQGEVTAPEGATYCSLCLILEGCSGTAWFDDLSFEMEETVQTK